MSVKLCQIVAVEKSVKNKTHTTVTEAYHKLQKSALLNGLTRSYRPKNEEGEQLPSETTKVQTTVEALLKDVSKSMSELFDVTATKDYANCKAVADVVVGDVVLAKSVPVTYLLFLEKKLVDLHTLISKLPVLDPAETWSFDPNVGVYASAPVETHRTKKEYKVITKAPATDKHPAQTEMVQVDELVGFWKTQKFSGALPASRVQELLDRVEKVQKAVKFAHEECNTSEVEQQKVGEKFFNFVFG